MSDILSKGRHERYEPAAEESDEDDLPKLFAWARRLPKEHVAAIMVSLDMWYLTPLLRSLIEGQALGVKLVFTSIVLFGVAAVCFLAVTLGRRFLRTRVSAAGLSWLLTALVFAEPFGAGYFAARTGTYVLVGPIEAPLVFLAISLFFVILMVRWAGFDKICENKYREAAEVVAARAS